MQPVLKACINACILHTSAQHREQFSEEVKGLRTTRTLNLEPCVMRALIMTFYKGFQRANVFTAVTDVDDTVEER